MRAWERRPKEEAYLLNPPFCGALLSVAVAEYGPMPFPLAFLILPVVLHKRTRELLPRDTRTSFVTWLQEHADARVQFAGRMRALRDHTRQALLHSCAHNWLAVEEHGLLQAAAETTLFSRGDRMLSDEAKQCLRRARFLGQWFARAGDSSTVMALWGVRP